jgi:hypothetical protein
VGSGFKSLGAYHDELVCRRPVLGLLHSLRKLSWVILGFRHCGQCCAHEFVDIRIGLIRWARRRIHGRVLRPVMLERSCSLPPGRREPAATSTARPALGDRSARVPATSSAQARHSTPGTTASASRGRQAGDPGLGLHRRTTRPSGSSRRRRTRPAPRARTRALTVPGDQFGGGAGLHQVLGVHGRAGAADVASNRCRNIATTSFTNDAVRGLPLANS